MNKKSKLFPGLTPRASSRLAAGAITMPFLLALPAYVVPDRAWWNIGWGAAIATLFLAAQFVAHRVARRGPGSGIVTAFAVLYLMLGLLGFAGSGEYRFALPVTDFVLLYLVFFSAALAGRLAPLLGSAVVALLFVPLALSAIVQAVHMQLFGFAIGPTGYRAILQSSASEALEFLGHFLGAGWMAAAAFAVALVVTAAFAIPPLRASGRALVLGGVCAAAALPILEENAVVVVSRFQGFEETVAYAKELMEYRALRKARESRALDIAVTQAGTLAGEPQTYVFIIGESLTRNHMSLYGYWRETTPMLTRVADEMVVFTDAVSPHSHTEYSLELVLTLANQSNGLRFSDASNYSLIEILRAAGFATWWISNHNSFGPWDNKTAALAAGAEHMHFTGRRSGRYVRGPLDEALLEPLGAALRHSAPRKAIFLHFLGNHWAYAKRYPAQAAAFRELPTPRETGAWRPQHPRASEINEYDNSVRYHDALVGRIIEMVRATGQAAVVTLFSDHGENLYGFKGHYWEQFTRDHVEVPLALWFSPEYVRLAGEVIEQARANARLPVALEDLPHLVASMAWLRSPLLKDEQSPLSAAYRAPTTRRLFERSLVYEEADEPLLNVRRALRRVAQTHPKLQNSVWAHRVNTLGKMMEVATLFAGAEIDVVYDAAAGALMVNHPPVAPSGLSLDELLEYANSLNPKLAIWLDVKNLDEANGERVLKELKRLDGRHVFRSRALVETTHTGPAAAALRQAGFFSSYYLPTMVVTQDAASVSGQDRSCRGAAQIRHVVEAGRFAAVSYDWRGRHWVEACLGRFLAQRGLRSYAWDLTPLLSDRRSDKTFDEERLRRYSAVSAVLLPFRSRFDDWR